MTSALPAGYLAVETRGARGFALTPALPWLERALREFGTLRAWAAHHARGTIAGGRSAVTVVEAPVPGPDGRAKWVCRACHRGGAIAPFLGDRYARMGEPRPVRELRASVEARARAVRTPAIVAAVTYPRAWYYRADVLTEYVEDTRSLADAVFFAHDAPAAEMFFDAGRLVASLERARVRHPDLNAHNILVSTVPPRGDAWVVDLDRCRVHSAGAPPLPQAMRLRLERSLATLGRRYEVPIEHEAWQSLRLGYEDRS